MENRKSRPRLCPCFKSCEPLYNGLAFDSRIADGDVNEGYSGDCIGKGDESEYVVGGQVHQNDMNHCVFTPLKGVIRFQINAGDVDAMLQMCQAVMHELNPHRQCAKCATSGRHIHWVVAGGIRYCCHCYHSQNQQGQTEI